MVRGIELFSPERTTKPNKAQQKQMNKEEKGRERKKKEEKGRAKESKK
jgi:hypothetical protein